MKKTIRMNERELHRLISESLKRVLNEDNFGDKTFHDESTQSNFKQDMIDMLASLDDNRFMQHFNNRLQVNDPDILDALWQEYVKRKHIR